MSGTDGAGGVGRAIGDFVQEVVGALGLEAEAEVEAHPDGLSVEITGAEAELLLRRKGEVLDALQLIVNTAFRRSLGEGQRIVVDACGFRQSKVSELRQMTRFLMERAKTTGAPQEIGPLNSYNRRIVHLEVATDPELASESQGDGASKQVIISRRA